jgi:hypothetical protein
MKQKQLSTEELTDRGSSRERERSDEPTGAGAESELAAELAGRARAGDGSQANETDADAERRQPLLEETELEHFRTRWQSIQTRFVDEPRGSVEQADSLVAEVTQQLARSFAQERDRLEGQWERNEDVSTEELRVALTRYRSFFDRLLSA